MQCMEREREVERKGKKEKFRRKIIERKSEAKKKRNIYMIPD